MVRQTARKKAAGSRVVAAGPLAGLVKAALSGLDKKRFTEEEMARIWEEAAGQGAARHTEPASLRRGILSVNVDDSGWLYELTVRKREIVAALRERAGAKRIKDIRFRIREVKKKTDERKERKTG